MGENFCSRHQIQPQPQDAEAALSRTWQLWVLLGGGKEVGASKPKVLLCVPGEEDATAQLTWSLTS